MNILILSKDGDLLGVAERLAREGHEVKTFAGTKNTGTGIYESISESEVWSGIKWCKFIISDQSFDQGFYDKVAMYNKPIVGNSYFGDLVNVDCIREYAIFDKFSVPTPETKVVSEIADVYRTVMDWTLPRYDIRFGRKWFAGKHTEFMAWAVNRLPVGETVLLQEPTVGDVDIMLMGFFNGNDFIKPFFVTDVNTEENRHCVVAPVRKDCSMPDQSLIRITNWLRSVDYHGLVNFRITMDKEEFFVREMNLKFSYPALYAILEGLDTPIGELFNNLAFSIKGDCEHTGKYIAALETTADDWRHLEGAPIKDLGDAQKLKHVFPVGVMKSDISENDYFVSGECSTIYTAAAWASSLNEAKKRVMRTIQNAPFPGMKFNPHVHLSANHVLGVLAHRNVINA